MKKLLLTIFAAAVILAGCNKSELATTNGGPGRLSVKITDDPFNINSVESATVTITKIEIRKAGANEGDPFIELLIDPVTIDLFQLRNGITQELADLEVPPGDYDLVRLYVDDANLKIKGIAEPFMMKVPSGEQTGIKVFIEPGIHVEGGISAELLLDFDLSKSFVMRGKMAHNGFIFKPCIKAANISTSGRIEGVVTDNSPEKNVLASAKVSIKNDSGDPIDTFTDESGYYAFIGVPAGTYSMSVTMENYEPINVESIIVFPGNKATQNFVLRSLPQFLSSVIENATPSILEMTYSLPLADIVPASAAFTVTVGTVARTVSSVSISDTKVLLTLSSAVVKDEIITVAYDKPATDPLQTAEGLQAASLSAHEVENKVSY